MLRLPAILIALSLAVVACDKDSPPPDPPRLSEVLPNLPLPPDPTLVSRENGADAVQVTVKSPEQVDRVAAYYRDLFKKAPWRLKNEASDQQGGVLLFAEQSGRPIWVRLRKNEAGGTLVDIAGARVAKKSDSVKTPATAPAGKPTS